MNRLEKRFTMICRDGIISIALDHFLAMFPASVLVPVLINAHFNVTVIDIPSVIIANALGTILFLIITKGRLPVYLGSSFAYIGLTTYLMSNYVQTGVRPVNAYNYVLWSYIFASAIMLILSFIYKYQISRRIMKSLFPTVIMGPVISLIGLELASFGAKDSGFNEISGIIDMKLSFVALFTLLIIIIASVLRRNFLRNSSIVVGVILGYILSVRFLGTDLSAIKDIPFFKLPEFTLPWRLIPKDLHQQFFAVLPATIVIFIESISRVTVVNGLKKANGESLTEIFSDEHNKDFYHSLRGHAASIFLSAHLGSVPTTIYAENIAVMSINNNDANNKRTSFNPFSVVPYVIAAVFSICVSFSGYLQYILMNIPKPVVGGVELFLFGIITAPGIQMLVEQRVNYRKVSNQILTASVLVAGIGGFTINLGVIEIKGMSLGLVIGVVLNILFKTFGYFGILNEYMTFDELVQLCKDKCLSKMKVILSDDNKFVLGNNADEPIVIVEKRSTNTYLSLKLTKKEIDEWIMIYDDIIDFDESEQISEREWMEILLVSKVPVRHISSMLKSAIT